MKIALAQIASPAEERPDERRARVRALLLDAPEADLIVLPELWAAGYFAFADYSDRAESLEGRTVSMARSIAQERNCYVHAGSFVERSKGGQLHNTAVIVDPSGAVALSYRKIHVFGYQSMEAQLLTPGDRLDVTRTRFGTLGTTTCYDLRFPAIWQDLAELGADLVVVPAAWPMARLAHWRLFTSCRAVEEQVFVIACNSVGIQTGGVQLAGHSRIVDPWGAVVYESAGDEHIEIVEIEPELVARTRAEFPVRGDRRAYDLPTARGPASAGSPNEEVGTDVH